MTEELDRSTDRLLAFTDAVVAIAITLLVLPLVEAFAEPVAHGETLQERLGDHLGQIGAFLLSFVIVGRLWWAHHRVSERVEAYSTPLVVLDLAWLLTIVVFPVTTAILATEQGEETSLQFLLYTGTLTASGLALAGFALVAHVDARCGPRTEGSVDGVVGTAVAAAGFAAALVVGLLAPGVGFGALFLLFLTPFADRLVKRVLARRARRV